MAICKPIVYSGWHRVMPITVVRPLDVDCIIEAVVAAVGIYTGQLTGPCKDQHVCDARWIAINQILTRIPGMPHRAIAALFGRYRSLVSYAKHAYADLFETDAEFRNKVERVNNLLKNATA